MTLLTASFFIELYRDEDPAKTDGAGHYLVDSAAVSLLAAAADEFVIPCQGAAYAVTIVGVSVRPVRKRREELLGTAALLYFPPWPPLPLVVFSQ